ncbi:multidrug resistance-associated protein 1-like isoform X2 [Lineus longissimus]
MDTAFESFCGSPFWNESLLQNTYPDLSPCFQNTVLVWVPCVLLLLTFPIRLYYLSSPASLVIHVNAFNRAKVILCILITFVRFLDILKYASDFSVGKPIALVYVVSPAVQTFTFMVATILIEKERHEGTISSAVLFIFWFILLITGIVPFYSYIINFGMAQDHYRMVTFYSYYSLLIVEFILHCFADEPQATLEVTHSKPCPFKTASFLSSITFHWMNKLVVTGFKKDLEESDIFNLSFEDTTHYSAADFEKAWKKEREKYKKKSQLHQRPVHLQHHIQEADVSERTPLIMQRSYGSHPEPSHVEMLIVKPERGGPSLMKVLVKFFGWTWLYAQLFKLVHDVLLFTSPVLLRFLINFTEDPTIEEWQGFLWAGLFFFSAIIQSLFLHQLYFWTSRVGLRLKACLVSALYRKGLTVSPEAEKGTSVGEIVNLMSVDVERIEDATIWSWIAWSSPFQIIIALWLLWNELGVAILAGLGVMVLLLPFNGCLASWVEKYQQKQMELKDSRIKLMTQVLSGIKVLKLYTWEASFQEKVNRIREQELDNIKKIAWGNAVINFSWTCCPFAIIVACFGTYIAMSPGNTLTAERAFVSMSLLNILRFPMTVLPMMISFLVMARVSIKRLTTFLKSDDIDEQNVIYKTGAGDPISIQNGTFKWSTDESAVLKNVNLKVPTGSLLAVVGQVGSGKSSLVSALLGEMIKDHGTVQIRGSVAYVAQQAWIQNASVRDNILFGKLFDQVQYNSVIEACALTKDLEMLPAGDKTEIGEKGINLSGGQKQRVALARAVYADSHVYYLDDPLSAVDSHVGKHIFDNVIGSRGLLNQKTRVLVTHGVHWLPFVDQIVVMSGGMISECGSCDELLSHDGDFAKFLRIHLTLNEDDGEEDDPEIEELKVKMLRRISEVDVSDHQIDDMGEIVLVRQQSVKDVLEEKGKELVISGEVLIEEEKVETGKVKLSVYMKYFSALQWKLFIPFLLCFVCAKGAEIYSNIWLATWTNYTSTLNSSATNHSDIQAKNNYYLGMFGGIGAGEAVFVVICYFIYACASVRASFSLHSSMLDNILKAPMAFFDTTPVGRIVNRFSRDMDTIDTEIPNTFSSLIDCMLCVVSTIVVISYSTPIFLAMLLPLSILYYLIQRFYLPSSRQLNRLYSKTKSPVFNHFNESLTGSTTIRAFKHQSRFCDELERRMDRNLMHYFAMFSSNRWLGCRLEILGSLVVFGAALFAVLGRSSLTGGLVGLSITYGLEITENLNWMVRMATNMETNVVSVERVKEYAEVQREDEWYRKDYNVPTNWPSYGNVAFEHYSTQYRTGLDLVLKGVSFHIKGGEKVGIVGRTGAGKSSLTLSLFRIIEATGGRICIDGVDIASLGLHQCRSKISILPQDAVLFSGSLRMNLDPFEQYSDEKIWQALEHAHLKEFVTSKTERLDYECGEGGKNLSVGQRQLVCLGRTLLRRTKILVFDEATAAVDLETDRLIQSTIREEFAECTILTIAHRLNTIMDNDRIMLLSDGQIVEFDSPTELLKKVNGAFYNMAKDAGLVSNF